MDSERRSYVQGLVRCAAALGLTLGLGAASASASGPPDYELAPTTRMMVQSIGNLVSGGHDEANYRAAQSGSTLKQFTNGARSYTLRDTGVGRGVVRLAVASQAGPVAILVQIPAPSTTVAGLPAPTNPYYALATVFKTRVAVWAFYDHVPDSGYLAQEISDSLSGAKHALAVFDPKFVAAATGSGPDRYILH